MTTIILIFLLIVLCILVAPFHIHLNLYNNGFKIHGTVKLKWLKLKLIQRKIPPKKKGKEKRKSKKKTEEKTKFDIKSIPKLFSLFIEAWPHIKRVLSAFLKSTSFEKLNLNLIMGTGDPFHTAIISGYLYAFAPMVNIIPKAHFFLETDFIKPRFDGHIEIEIKIRLLRIVFEVVRAYTKKPVRQLIKSLNEMRS
ncbi:DUF2953 domain-containing protein [Methanobacterium sp.]|uniref:DUF2953 domain-containing protein n=1 Tax=Methanobacterium sp. TaxID=2164 RepID=UPI003D646404